MVYWEYMSTELKELLERAERWPSEAREELVAFGHEIEGEVSGTYQATPGELRGVERGLKAANEGRFASATEVEAALAKFRVE